MYEAKYSKYITKSSSRFASSDEIKSLCEKIDKDSIKSGCGAVLYSEGDTIYVDNSDAHIYIQGATGSKKSRIEATLIILSTIKAGENLVVNDPKGELYSRTVHYAIENGYKIRLLNFRDEQQRKEINEEINRIYSDIHCVSSTINCNIIEKS